MLAQVSNEQITEYNGGMSVWVANSYIWDNHFNDSSQVGKWFIDAGG